MILSLAKRLLKLVGGVFLVVAVLLAFGFVTGAIGVPSVTVEDPGEWGTTTEETTEIETTLAVENPNPLGVTVSDGFSARYWVALNDVRLVEGQRESISIPKGSNTITLTSTMDNDRIVPWWAEYVRANETIRLRDGGGDGQRLRPAPDIVPRAGTDVTGRPATRDRRLFRGRLDDGRGVHGRSRYRRLRDP